VVQPAERLGYVVVSSYNTLSDGPSEPNSRAVSAILADLPQRYAVNTHRLYFAGFSGTARVSWGFAPLLSVPLAGILGFGAGLPNPSFLRQHADAFGPTFSFFGGTGVIDFNFDEVRELDALLDGYGIAHRVRSFDGPHAWAPAAVFAEALEWMELRAMKTGLRLPDRGLIEEFYRRRLAEARALESADQKHDAYVRYRAMVEDFDGIRDIAEVLARSDSLEGSDAVKNTTERLDRLARRTHEAQRRLSLVLQMARTGTPLPPERAVEHLRIRRLQEEARATDDPLGAQGAERALRMMFVHTVFYEPRQHLADGEPEAALAVLAIAEAIRPGSPRVCQLGLRAHLALGHTDEALDALECLADAGWLSAERIAADPDLAPLRGDPRYRALVQRLQPGGG
jgi:hypothetical protein